MQQLIFDGNYLLHKNVSTLHKMNRLHGDLYNVLCNNIEKYKNMHKFDQIFIVSDSKKKSWRLDESDIYKGTRKSDPEIDWKAVYEIYEQWKQDIGQKYTVIERDRIEGDDWIAVLVRKGNKLGYSNVIIASDRDLNQLLNYKINGEKSYINLQISDINTREVLYLPIGWEIFIKEYDDVRSGDPFNLDSGFDWMNFLQKIIRNFDYKVIDPHEHLFCKLIKGDGGDNVKSIYEKLTSTGKIRGIGDAGAQKVWNFYRDNYKGYFTTTEATFLDDVINSFEKAHKLTMTDSKKELAIQNLKRNIKLMELHHRHYPEWVLEEIASELEDKI